MAAERDPGIHCLYLRNHLKRIPKSHNFRLRRSRSEPISRRLKEVFSRGRGIFSWNISDALTKPAVIYCVIYTQRSVVLLAAF